MIIPSIKVPVNSKNRLIRELDDRAICTNPVQQLSTAVQTDYLHPIGQKMSLIFCKRGQAQLLQASKDRYDAHSPLVGYC